MRRRERTSRSAATSCCAACSRPQTSRAWVRPSIAAWRRPARGARAPSRAGTLERRAAPAKLRALIAETKDYPGVTGTITLDEQRNASKPLVVLEIKGGKKVFNTSIKP